MKHEVEWSHYGETTTQSERWIAHVGNTQLTVVALPSPYDEKKTCYYWMTNRTGADWRTGSCWDLEVAMVEAIRSETERNKS